MRMRQGGYGAHGGLVHEELLGKSRYEEMTDIDRMHFEYAPRRTALNEIKKMQPSDPTEPAPDFANTVHYYIFEKLGIDAKELEFYTAVISPLDTYHGIDCWFEIKKGGRLKRVTVDVTLDPNKVSYKADIVFLVPDGGLDRKVDKEQFIQYSESLADEVVRFFKGL